MFGQPQDLINTMKGQGQLGPLLTMMGMKPVKFQSESDFAKSISTESKIFSIYAVGVVDGKKNAKGDRRQTRSSMHTVVDFRAAPSLVGGGMFGSTSSGGSAAPPPKPAGTATGGATPDPNNGRCSSSSSTRLCLEECGRSPVCRRPRQHPRERASRSEQSQCLRGWESMSESPRSRWPC
jgi:hypothetical protein